MHAIGNKIIGGFELLFLFGRGIRKFTGTRQEAVQSIAAPVLAYGAGFFIGDLYPPKGMEQGYGTAQIIGTMTAHFLLSFVLASLLVAALARQFGRGGQFLLYFSASNWTAVPLFIINLPLLILAERGIAPRATMDQVFTIMALYTYAVTGCIAYSALRVNWMLAGFIAIAVMFVNQELWHILYLIQGIPIPW